MLNAEFFLRISTSLLLFSRNLDCLNFIWDINNGLWIFYGFIFKCSSHIIDCFPLIFSFCHKIQGKVLYLFVILNFLKNFMKILSILRNKSFSLKDTYTVIWLRFGSAEYELEQLGSVNIRLASLPVDKQQLFSIYKKVERSIELLKHKSVYTIG